MAKETQILECNIQPAGIPFSVTEKFKDTVFSPGTTGLTSYIMGPDHNNPNILFLQVVTTRRGKGGKPRINNNMILTPIYKVPRISDELLFPKAGDKKHFVDIELDLKATPKIFGQNNPIDDNFLACLLSKSLFMRELDKVVYPPEHRIMESLGMVGERKQVFTWPKEKTDKLKNFVANVERWHNEGATDSIFEEFSNEASRQILLSSYQKVEAALVIPRLEYDRKICEVLLDALKYIEETVSNKKNKVADRNNLVGTIKNTRKEVQATQKRIGTLIDTRLGIIRNSREILRY